jgi:hypothetical protein
VRFACANARYPFQAFSDSFRYRRRRLPLWMYTARLRRNEECDGQETDAGDSPPIRCCDRGGIHFAAPECRTAAPDCRTARRQRGSARVRVVVESPIRRSAAPMRRSGELAEGAPQCACRPAFQDDILVFSTRLPSRRHDASSVSSICDQRDAARRRDVIARVFFTTHASHADPPRGVAGGRRRCAFGCGDAHARGTSDPQYTQRPDRKSN